MSAMQEPARQPDDVPAFRVVRGVPTTEELAALVGAILLRPRPDAPAEPATAPTWSSSARPGQFSPAGLPARPGRDAWRMSALPR